MVEDNDGDDDGDGEDNGDDVEDIDDVEDDDHLVLVDGFLLSLSSSLTLSPIKLLGPVARVARELREELLTKIIVKLINSTICFDDRDVSVRLSLKIAFSWLSLSSS